MTLSLTGILLQEVGAERSDSIIAELASGGAIRVPPSTDIVAHFVLEGKVSVEVDDVKEPLTICRGEYGLLLYGSGHRVHLCDDDPGQPDHVIGEWPTGEEPTRLMIGEGKAGVKLLSAALRSVYSPVSVKSLHPLPELMHLRHGLQPLFKETALLTDTAQIGVACSGPGANAFVNALMNLHMFHAMRCGYQRMQEDLPLLPPMEIVRSPSARPVAAALRLLRMHPERHWTIAELARELGQSRSALAANFNACVGIGPMGYLNKVRMEKAAELLRSRRDLSLCTIGRQVGYDSSSSFARAFKAHFGVPPKTFSAGDNSLARTMEQATSPLAVSHPYAA